jgi:hypothetical protein
LHQDHQKINGNLWQRSQIIGGDLLQGGQKIKCNSDK